MHKVYCYFENLDQRYTDEHRSMINHWSRSWAKHGWSPEILGLEDAKRNPMFDEFDQRCRKLPTVNSTEYELSCYRRWLAVATVGGGFMSDYDVINYGFKPRSPESDLVIYEANVHGNSVTPSVVGGTAFGFIQACLAFSTPEPSAITSEARGEPHTSDMIIMQLFEQRRLYNISPTVIQYGGEGWESAPLVHYSNETTHNTDRAQCVMTARPL